MYEKVEKIYVSPDQVVLTTEGIFFITDAGLTPVSFISSDIHGLYVMRGYYQCPACGRYNANDVCQNSNCPMFGQ